MVPETTIEIVLAFVNAPTWLESKQVVKQYHEFLLSDKADRILQMGIARNQHRQEIARRLEYCRLILQDCREIGIDAAFVFPIGPKPELLEVLKDLLGAESPTAAYHTVTEHADLLLSDEADWTLIALAASDTSEDTFFVDRIAHRREMLARCRCEGIDAAFAELLRKDRLNEGFQALVRAYGSVDETEQVLRRYQDVLLTEEAEQEIAAMQASLEDDELQENVAQLAESLSVLLSLARTDGIRWAVLFSRFPPFERFLHRAFRAMTTREDESQETYPDIRTILETNLALLDESFLSKLREWGRRQIDDAQPDEHLELYVSSLGNFAQAIKDFPQGNRADNQEIAIACHQLADTFCERLDKADLHARILSNLGFVYMERVRESRRENVEQAIHCLEQSLALIDQSSNPKLWAQIADGLGNAYVDRQGGERISDIETAIKLYNDALRVISCEQYPEVWSSIHNDLGLAYFHRIHGESAENIEQAISHCEQALSVLADDSHETRCVMYSNLMLYYVSRVRGEHASNIERTIQYGQEILAWTDRTTAPLEWGKTQLNLGRAYASADPDEDGENIEQAIKHYQLALEVFDRASHPNEWARLQNNLGNNILRRKQGDPDENKALAIQHIEQALEIYTRDAYPEEWARSTNDLAAALTHVPFHIYTDIQEGWDVMTKIGAQYNRAIELLLQALEVRAPELMPWESTQSAYLCGQAMATHGRYAEARTALEIAHRAIQAMRGETSRESAKRNLSAMTRGVYERLVQVCLRLNDVPSAFAYAAASKGHAFTDLLASTRFDLSTASTYPELASNLQQAHTLRQQIDRLLAYLSGETSSLPVTPGGSPRAIEKQLRELQQKEQTLWEDMAYAYPLLTATQQAPQITAAEAQNLAATLQATLVEFYPYKDDWSAFVVTDQSIVHVLLPLLTEEFFERLIGMVQRIGSRIGRGSLSYRYLEDLHKAVIAPLRDILPQGQRLILAPYGSLHRLPLAAAYDPQTGQYAADTYRLAFAPGIAALWVAWQQSQRKGQSLLSPDQALSVAYPGARQGHNYLPQVLSEAEAVASHFAATVRLYEENATPDAVIKQCTDRNILHLGCHGAFDQEHPEQSGLMLAGGWLTVRRILTEMQLDEVQICTLGACVSGLAHVAEGDEPIGLAHAMLAAGSQAVVASQWNVQDAATRVLFETFYDGIAAGSTPADALYEATRVVRQSPQWQHPYYWAAFQVMGLAHLSTTTRKPINGH